MTKLTVALMIILIIALAAGAYVYFFKTYQDSQIDTVLLYQNDIKGKAMEDIGNSVEEQNQRLQEQLNQ